MSFRRDGRYEHRWKQWVAEHQAFLTGQCGLPLAIVGDREEWFHFLDHGFSRSVPLSKLTDIQREQFVSFLSDYEGSTSGPASAITLKSLARSLGGSRCDQELDPSAS